MSAVFSVGGHRHSTESLHAGVEPWFLAHAQGENPREAVETCLAQLAEGPADATIGMVYVTEQMAPTFETALELLRLHRPGVTWVGATVPAVLAGDKSYRGVPAIAVMLAEVPVDQFRILSGARSNLAGLISRLSGWRQRNGRCDAVIHGDANNAACGTMLAELSRKLHSGTISGGLTASRRDGLQVAVTVTSGGLSGVMFGRHIELINGSASGATPIGLPHAITGIRGNIVHELDYEPAIEVLRREAGELLARDPKRLSRFISPAVGPMPDQHPAYLQRRFVEFDFDRGSFRLDEVPAGLDCVRFYRRDPDALRMQFESMVHAVKMQAEGREVLGAMLVYSDPHGLENSMGHELKRVAEVFDNVPVIGFRGWGEIHNGSRLGNSVVLTLFTAR